MNNLLGRNRTQTVYVPGGGSGGGGSWPPPADSYQKWSVAIVAGTQSYVVTLGTTMSGAPTVFSGTFQMADSSGNVLGFSVEADTITANGFTIWLTGVPTADGVLTGTAQV